MKKTRKTDSRTARTNLAIRALCDTMKTRHITLSEVCRAVNIMAECAFEQIVMHLRGEGYSIRRIARAMHRDESRISAAIRSNGGSTRPCGHHVHSDTRHRMK